VPFSVGDNASITMQASRIEGISEFPLDIADRGTLEFGHCGFQISAAGRAAVAIYR
jgi:hypothetical protein